MRARFAPAGSPYRAVRGTFAAGFCVATISLGTAPAIAEATAQETDRVPATAIKTTMPKMPATRRSAAALSRPGPQRRGRLPRIYGEDERRPLVVIDAGHGGVDPGAISPIDGRREKDVTLKIARAIRDELVRAGRVRVALTREDDRFLILRERYGIARRLGGALFISIHCDSVGSGAATGASVYTLSEVASDRESARLAARENKSDIIAGVNLASTNADISSILIDLTQRETMNASAGFARLLGREARDRVPLKPNFHRMASLMVLKAPDMPSVLFETGYISNPADAEFIDSEDGRQRIAESVARAVEIHFARRMANR
nr:N-acetylmuramoyl-L-alanine amidase [Sphingomonas echinoides]